nr:hypothetical protein GCM10020093_102130 [Planobispora longispora]
MSAASGPDARSWVRLRTTGWSTGVPGGGGGFGGGGRTGGGRTGGGRAAASAAAAMPTSSHAPQLRLRTRVSCRARAKASWKAFAAQ